MLTNKHTDLEHEKENSRRVHETMKSQQGVDVPL